MPDLPRLGNATLGGLAPAIQRPGYDRSRVEAGIVHLGLGAFHRGHQAVFADDALGRGDRRWGIVAASLRSAETRDALAPQDGLYTFALKDATETRLRIIGSLTRMIVAPEDPEALIAALAHPGLLLVTLTITEKGYAVDLSTGRLDRAEPAVAADLAGGGPPRSALGFLAAGLMRRAAAGAPRLAILSCDNLPRNGETLRAVLGDFLALKDPGLAARLDDLAAFPSSMVDRIVPATTPADRAAIDAALGLADAWPVVAEPAFDWIVEDRFPGERPPFEASGVRFVADVEPYEHMKLRLLNGAHTAIAAIGRLAGLATVPQAVGDARVQRFLAAYWAEAMPTLRIEPSVARDYRDGLLPRFSNPQLPHRTAQIAKDASQKVPQRLLAGLRDRLAAGEPADAMIFAVAAWIRSCGGVDDAGGAFTLDDPVFERWSGRPDQERLGADAVVDAFLGFEPVFGHDLPKTPAFTRTLRASLADIVGGGVLAAMARRFA